MNNIPEILVPFAGCFKATAHNYTLVNGFLTSMVLESHVQRSQTGATGRCPKTSGRILYEITVGLCLYTSTLFIKYPYRSWQANDFPDPGLESL